MANQTIPTAPDNGTDNNAAAATAAALQPNRRALAGLLQLALVFHRNEESPMTPDLADLLHNIPTALADEFEWDFFCQCWDIWTERAGPRLMATYAGQVEIYRLMDERRAQAAATEGQ